MYRIPSQGTLTHSDQTFPLNPFFFRMYGYKRMECAITQSVVNTLFINTPDAAKSAHSVPAQKHPLFLH